MIPAFPMDGGRVLRAVLAMRMNYARATQLAAETGQAIAFVFFIIGLWWNPMLLLIAVFIYFGAGSEAALAQMKSISKDLRVSTAMVTQFQTLPIHATLNEAVEALLRTSQHEFPVIDELGKVRGILTRDDMIAGLRRSATETAGHGSDAGRHSKRSSIDAIRSRVCVHAGMPLSRAASARFK